MPNPLHLLHLHSRRPVTRHRRTVPVPTAVPTTDAIFLVMRRMRAPFLVVIATFSACTAGMMLMPGKDPDGHLHYHTFFDAFYQMTITLTTVGYSEVPYSLSYPQRMWLTVSIFLLVVSWAYAIGAFFALMQDPAFTFALATQRFRRRVGRMREPFFIIAGYGQAGRTVGYELDERRRRFVVIDRDPRRVESLAAEQLVSDVPADEADCRNPATLGVSGLGHKHCEAVLALTDDDEANLAVVMSASVLRPDLPVLARCSDRRIQTSMEKFSPTAIINASDRYGRYLALALHRPVVHQLLLWLMDNDEHKLPKLRRDLAQGTWIVYGDGDFAHEVTMDLRITGVDVDYVDPSEGEPDVTNAVGFVAGTENDILNIAMAEHARLTNPDIYVCVRQKTNSNKSLLLGLQVNSVFIATDLVAREVLARVLTPVFWSFVEQVFDQDDEWATALRDRLVTRCGWRTPEREVLTISRTTSPAIVDWLTAGRQFTITDLLRRSDNRDAALPVVPLVLIHDGHTIVTPDEDTALQVGDALLLVGKPQGLADVADVLHYPDVVEYLVTGHDVPATWLWRRLTAHRRELPPVVSS